MTIKQIEKQVAKRDQLTEVEKAMLANAILKNKKAKEIVINGAISLNNWNLVTYLCFI